ncbi:hypothetical protein DLREEDagr8_03190 [Dongia sp. agr-C8]
MPPARAQAVSTALRDSGRIDTVFADAGMALASIAPQTRAVSHDNRDLMFRPRRSTQISY